MSRNYHRGENHHSWKGGKKITDQGYVMVMLPEHPRAGGKGYVFEHLVVLEKTLGRPILPTEVAHHIDGNRSNNAVGNLILFKTRGMHTAYHTRLKAFEVSGHYDWRKCTMCQKYNDPQNMKPGGFSFFHNSCRLQQYEEKRVHLSPFKPRFNARQG